MRTLLITYSVMFHPFTCIYIITTYFWLHIFVGQPLHYLSVATWLFLVNCMKRFRGKKVVPVILSYINIILLKSALLHIVTQGNRVSRAYSVVVHSMWTTHCVQGCQIPLFLDCLCGVWDWADLLLKKGITTTEPSQQFGEACNPNPKQT